MLPAAAAAAAAAAAVAAVAAAVAVSAVPVAVAVAAAVAVPAATVRYPTSLASQWPRTAQVADSITTQRRTTCTRRAKSSRTNREISFHL